jgi:RTX toxin RtxA
MIGGQANIFTKVGNGTTVAIMLAGHANVGPLPTLVKKLAPTDTIKAALMPSPTWVSTLPTPNIPTITGGNIFTHIGNGLSAALMIGGQANIFTKVGNGTTVAIMLAGHANIFTHVV